MKPPYRDCPRFDKCNVNVCPIDPDIELRTHITGEPKCTMEKGVRLRLGKDLPNFGLKPLELKAKRIWDGLSEKEKARRRHAANEMRLKHRTKSKKTQGTALLGATREV